MSEVKMSLQWFKNEVVLPAKSTIGIVRSDNGTEYFNREVIQWLVDENIQKMLFVNIFQTTIPSRMLLWRLHFATSRT